MKPDFNKLNDKSITLNKKFDDLITKEIDEHLLKNGESNSVELYAYISTALTCTVARFLYAGTKDIDEALEGAEKHFHQGLRRYLNFLIEHESPEEPIK